ncbi:phage holin family protein [Yersinia aldovae]|uniref:Protein of uncharacterized function (DUF754) n=1 Tax=Yersinia aldovae TaxID=29483 RepID=A0ABM9SXK1_YERAL|nr:phage holin family protein [Yersinia aldovae]CNL62667.1 Protein of uncharacterised function (DUF754) [Yersinia aldovae]
MIDVNSILITLNAISCSLIALRLIAFQRNGAGYNRAASLCAFVLIAASGTVAIRIAFGQYAHADPAETLLNLALCVVVFTAKGNIRHLTRPMSSAVNPKKGKPS